MGVIFISHSSKNNAQAVRVRDWLREQGWKETFLDLDPEHGLAPGQKWQEELKRAGERCSAVVVLVSPEWAASKWCLTEFLLASQLGKRIFPVIIAPTPFADLPIELTAHFQLADISEADKEADGFERLHFGLKRAGLDPTDFPWPPPSQPGRSPYRGLRTLEEEDAAIFFGRDAAITGGLDDLRKMRDGSPKRMLVILGASGAGKSSFLRAGLLSRLRRDTENFIVLPIVRPERASLTGAHGLLRSVGAEQSGSHDAIAERMAAVRAPVIANFQRLASASGETWTGRTPTIVLPIDQAEEFFSAENSETPAALELLDRLVVAEPDLIVVLTIRSDSFELIQSDASLANIPIQPFNLQRLSSSAFKEVIEGPGRVATPRIAIEPALTERLLADLNSGDALPLLAFTLERLVTDYGADGKLELLEYQDSLGGLSGAIGKAVEAAFVSAAADPKLPRDRSELEALARSAFIPWLVRIDDTDSPPKRRVAQLSELPDQTRSLVSKFIDQRLLVSDETADGNTIIEVSHEAVLRNWGLLSAWISAERETLGRAERVIRAAADWRGSTDTQGRPDRTLLVHRGERLLGAEAVLQREDFVRLVGDSGVEYVRACREQERREEDKLRSDARARRFRGWAVAASLVIVSAMFLGLGLFGIDRARTALAIQSRVAGSDAIEAMESGDPIVAPLLALEAWGDEGAAWWSPVTRWMSPDRPEASAALKFSLEPEGTRIVAGAGHIAAFASATFSPDGKQLLTVSKDGTMQVWDAGTGAQVRVIEGNGARVRSAVFSPDGKQVLTTSGDINPNPRLWDARTGIQLRVFEGHTETVSSAVFSPDGKQVLTGSSDMSARLWDAGTGAQLRALEHSGLVESAIFSPDGRQILTASTDGFVRVWDAATGAQLSTLKDETGSADSAIFSPDGKQVLTTSYDKEPRLWDAATGSQLRVFGSHSGLGASAVFSPDGKQVLTAMSLGNARLWDAGTGAQLRIFGDKGSIVWSAIFSPDGTQVLTLDVQGPARLWDVATGLQLFVLENGTPAETSAIFSPDGKRVFTSTSYGTARLWDAGAGTEQVVLEGHSAGLKSATFSPDDMRVLTASDDGTARLWDAGTGAKLRVLKGHSLGLTSARFSLDGKLVLTASYDNTARLWDAGTGAQLLELRGHTRYLTSAIFSPDGKQILTASDDRTARLWDAGTGVQLRVFEGHTEGLESAVFSSDGKQVLTASGDMTPRLWDTNTGAQLRTIEGSALKVTSAIFSPDGKQVLTASFDGTVRLWDAGTGAQLRLFQGHTDAVTSVTFSPDGKLVLTASRDSTARLWDSATGVQLRRFQVQESFVWSARFSPDGKQVLTASSSGATQLWDTETGVPLRQLRGHFSDVLSATFSHDGTKVITGGADATWGIWAARDGAMSFNDEWELANYARQHVVRCLTSEERQEYGLGAAPNWCRRFAESSISSGAPEL